MNSISDIFCFVLFFLYFFCHSVCSAVGIRVVFILQESNSWPLQRRHGVTFCHVQKCWQFFPGWFFAFAMHEFSISERKICLLPVKIRSVLQEHSTIAQYVIERSSTKQVWCSVHNKNVIHASAAKDHLPNSNLTGTLIPPKIIRKIFTMLLVQAIFNSWLNLCELSFQTNQGNLTFPVQNYNTDTRRSTARLSADTTIVLSLCSAIQMENQILLIPKTGEHRFT